MFDECLATYKGQICNCFSTWLLSYLVKKGIDVNLLIDDSTILDEIDDAGWHDQFNGNESGDHWAWGVEFLRRHGARYSDELM